MNPHFKKPLKITWITFVVGVVLVIVGATWIYNQKLSDRRMKERAAMMGSGVGLMTFFVLAPVWIMAGGKVGKERRAAKEAEKKNG